MPEQARKLSEILKEMAETLLGKVKFTRPYYQCLLGESTSPQPQGAGEPEETACSHGEAPAALRRAIDSLCMALKR